jgi:hypothetical protein
MNMSPAHALAPSDDQTRPATALELWERFRTCLEAKVSEGNILAGERLWATAPAQETDFGVVVRSTASAANYAELVFDPARARLRCKFGPAIGRPDCELQLRGECDQTTDEAVFCVLDALIFPDQI